MSKNMKVDEIIEASRFLVSFGDELEAEDGFDKAIDALLGKADDKIGSLTYVIGLMSRSYGALLSRSEENAAAAERYEKRRGFLVNRRETLIAEALELAESSDDAEAVERLKMQQEADPMVQGYLLTIPSGAVDGASDYDQRRWAEQVLTMTVGAEKRGSKIVEALKSHDEPLLAARLMILAGNDRAKYLQALAKEIVTAAKAEEAIVKKVKDLSETRLKKEKDLKYTDSLGGWIRITSRTTAVVVHPDYDGKGKIKGPDVDLLPDEYVKTTKEAKKKELATALKAVQGFKSERAVLALELEEADSDEEKEKIKAAIKGLGSVDDIPGAKLFMSPSSFVGNSK
jgi:hypothetical protein